MFRNILLFIYEYSLWIISYFIKKDANVWIFGAMRGTKYLDNSRYLFEYVSKTPKIKAIWISKNKTIVEELQKQGFSAFHEYSYNAIYYASKAKVAVITHRGNRKEADLPFYLFSKKTKIIQLWHGIGLKKSAFDDKVFSFTHNENTIMWKLKIFLKNSIFPFFNYVNNPSLILSLSIETQDSFAKAFRVSKDKVLITGYPRNDILLKNIVLEKDFKQKRIIYMPTFRGSVNSDFDLFLQYGLDVEKFDEFLSQKKMTLDIKLHPFNKPSSVLIKKLVESKNIFLLEHDAIYEIITEYDMLITDYSSIYFDYLLLDRPIIFAPFDIDIYLREDREFNFEYNEVTPGPKAMNWEEVMRNLEMFDENTSLYSKERKEIKDRFHTFQDDKSTQRVYEAILNIINND